MGQRHDHDAGGDPQLLQAKAGLREDVWQELQDADASRFPGAEGRIPNFVGAEDAADRLRELDAWQRAATIKANPDSPQWPVRQRALQDGKTVFMAVPRLKEEQPFFLLDPDELKDTPRKASSIKGASRNTRTVGVDELEPVDLVVVESVAVSLDAARLGKGGGFSDLEFAIAQEAGLIGALVRAWLGRARALLEGQVRWRLHEALPSRGCCSATSSSASTAYRCDRTT